MEVEKLREWFNRPGRTGVLSTAGQGGIPNGAVFGSARLMQDGTLLLALGENRSLRHLSENPRAVFTSFDPGPHPLAWEGVRLYLEVIQIVEDGPVLEEMRTQIRQAAGEGAARRIRAAVVFQVKETRPLIDLSP